MWYYFSSMFSNYSAVFMSNDRCWQDIWSPQETSEHCDEERCGFLFIGECTQHMENTRLDKCTEHKFYDMQSFHLEQPDLCVHANTNDIYSKITEMQSTLSFGVQEFEVIIYKTLHKIFLSNNYHNIISCIARLLSPELLKCKVLIPWYSHSFQRWGFQLPYHRFLSSQYFERQSGFWGCHVSWGK